MKKRCAWVDLKDPLYIKYHDEEWGKPVYDDQILFEFLVLEGAQAGLSWQTILHKRAHYKIVFDGFDPLTVARYDDAQIEALLADKGIVRNRLKVKSAVKNAQVFLSIQKEYGSFANYLWGYVKRLDMETKKNGEASSVLSDALSKDLKRRGMSFVGKTIIHAFLQAVGVVNEHDVDCDFR